MSEKYPKLEIIQIPAQGLELYVKVPEVPAGVPRSSSRDLVVMLLLGKWLKELNIVVMECYYRWNPIDENGVPPKGYRQRMYREWLA